MEKRAWQIPVTIVLIFVGILLTLQFQTQTRVLTDLTMQKTEHLITMVRNLSDKRTSLMQELETLETKLQELRVSGATDANIISNLNSDLKRLSIVNGSKDVSGPGLTVTFSEYDPILYTDLIIIINELWAAGAEAVAINDTRIALNSVIFYGEGNNSMYITADHIPLSYPIVIKAIGNPNTLDKGLTLPGGIMDNLALFQAFPEIEQVEELTLPAVEDKFIFYEAKEVENKKTG